ncbi:hypothetical protein AURDEDRAFT_167999 [Auricularia subglabra TFB-10046 SS5]|nr:hypothetical protein AURDEDRAFT_167999 [Auricularia subglabra TFB-10046 SS5]
MDAFLSATGSNLLAVGVSEDSAKFLRVASITIGAYDYFLTLPAEYRFYTSQTLITRPSLACVLFILIRYISIITIVVSNIGAFATFTIDACEHFYLVSPSFKVVQIIVCQAILSVRTFAISKRNKPVGWLLGIMFITFAAGQWFVNLFGRVPNVGTGHCTSGNEDGLLIAYVHYIFAMIFDLVTLLISSYYLLGRSPMTHFSFSRIVRILLFDGIGYFFLLTIINVLNLIMYKTSPKSLQSAGASLGYAVTWIMSQRILIHLHEISDSSSRGRTPKDARGGGMGGQPDSGGGSGHEMGIRITIRKDIEHDGDPDLGDLDPTKTQTLHSDGAKRDTYDV